MYNVLKKIKKHWDFGLGRTALAAVCAHSVSISIGICQGYSAILIPQLMYTQDIVIDQEESSWLASFGAVTNPIGSILSGLLAEWMGRKFSMQISSVPFLLGWICIGLAKNIQWLYIGRLITGVAAGMSAASYTYVTETSTPKTRGFLQALGPISASFGILLTYTLGYFVRWNLVAYLSTIFAVFTLITVQFLPESPSYLLSTGKKEECFESLLWFRRNNALAQDEFDQNVRASKTDDGGAKKSPYLSVGTVKPFFILVTLFLLQELSGIYSILFYAVNFFRDSKVGVDENVSSIIVGLIRFVMAIFAAILINKYTRKSLCMVSSIGMGLSMLAIVVYLEYYQITGEEPVFTSLPLVGVLLNVLFSMVGMLPIPWILIGEMFPLQVRSIMSGVIICIAQFFIFVCVKIYPDMIAHLKFSGTCVVFMCASFLAVLFTKFFLPETKDKTLEEIENNFKRKKLSGVDNEAFDEKPELIRYTGSGCNPENVFTIQVT